MEKFLQRGMATLVIGLLGLWLVDRRPSSGHGRITSIALFHPANLLQEAAFYRRRWRATLTILFP
jgi:hypothetical protein